MFDELFLDYERRWRHLDWRSERDADVTDFSFFADRAGSISTLDSLDFTRYSDDGNRESDDRVAGKCSA